MNHEFAAGADSKMSHCSYYQYQANARGVHTGADVERGARERAYIYDRIVLPWLPADSQSRIAELACGHGSFLCWLKNRGFVNIVGVDSSTEQIALAGQVAEVRQADVNEWLRSQGNESYQVLVAIDFIEHISKDSFIEFLHESFRVLAQGGRVVLRYPNGGSPLVGHNLFADITHVWTYSPGCLQTLAQMHGFASAIFFDEDYQTIRDHRWLKVPIGRFSSLLLRVLFRAATRVEVDYWSPNLWACLIKSG
jgi:2-polyprenyl-3-methyl-5-hydroxy-6-metoxy-1,4-benzoquinol methylase